MCEWCGADVRLEGSASRCTRCGGAHWACATASCRGQLNAADRRFCPVCGGARSTHGDPDAHKLPRVTVVRAPLPVRLASKIRQDQGFYPRTAEGLYIDGRMVLAGMREILAMPAPEKDLAGASPGLGVLYQSPESNDSLNSPLPLKNGALLMGGREGVFAISTYTGEKSLVSKNRSHMAPIGYATTAARSSNPPNVTASSAFEKFTEIWALENDDKSAPELARYAYRARPCIEIGRFEKLDSIPAPEGIVAATAILNLENELSPTEPWFLIQNRATRELTWRRALSSSFVVPPSSGKISAALQSSTSTTGLALQPAGECGRSRVPGAPGRQRLWENKGGEGIYWLSRAGLENDDGALELTSDDAHVSRELDVAFSWVDGPAHSLYTPPLNLARERSLDGTWARVGAHDGAHFAWTAINEDDVRVTAEPELKDWGAGWVIDILGFKPAPGNVGPVLPTPWGFVTSAISSGPQPQFCAIYADFPLR